MPTAGVIAAAAAPNIVPLSFELGGKSPLLVFDDADLDLAVNLAVEQFDNAGQVCLGAFRILVQDGIADEFLERVRAKAATLVQGDPRDEATDVSALVSRPHFERVAGFVERAIAAGAKRDPRRRSQRGPRRALLRPDDPGRRRAEGSEILTEEVFGPVLTVQTFGTEEEGVAMANNTRFGLAATLVTGDPERAERVSSAAERRHGLGQLLLRPRPRRTLRRQRQVRHRPRGRRLLLRLLLRHQEHRVQPRTAGPYDDRKDGRQWVRWSGPG